MTAQSQTTQPHHRRRRKKIGWQRTNETRSAIFGMSCLISVFVLLIGFILFCALSRSDRFVEFNSSPTGQLLNRIGNP